jgi:SH3 domain-containing protein
VLRRVVFLLGCFAASPLAAGQTKLTSEAIKTTVAGSLVELDTPIGTTVSVRFGHDGLMSGQAGALASVLGAATDRGRWWSANDKLCFKWFRWFDAEERCVSLALDAKRIFWEKDDGDSGTGTIVEPGTPASKPAPKVIVAQVTKAAKPSPKPEPLSPSVDAIAAAVVAQSPAPPLAVVHVTSVKFAAPAIIADQTPGSVLNVPAPRPAVRPKPRVAITVISKTKPAAKSSAGPTGEASKQFHVAGVDVSDALNVRSGPSQDASSVGVIAHDGSGITIVGNCSNDWCLIKHRNVTGWVNRRYLVADGEPEQTANASQDGREYDTWFSR